jgi:hypothetical protein
MAGKYYQTINGTNYDVATLCEPKVYEAAPGFGTKFTGEGEFQKASTDTENITLNGYTVAGTPITTVKNGYFPLFRDSSLIWEKDFGSSSSSDTKLIRTDASLSIGSATFTPSDFRNGKIPSELIFVVVGAGGGGGGSGSYSPGKDKGGYAAIPGGGGGGGGIAIVRMNVREFTKSNPLLLYVGYENLGGGDSMDLNSSGAGGKGANGWSSYLRGNKKTSGNITSYTYYVSAGGGKGGTAGAPSGDNGYKAGTAGAGGTATVYDSSLIINKIVCNGGAGNQSGSLYNTTRSSLSVKLISSVPETTLGSITNNGTSWNQDTQTDSAYSGGCSLGRGGCLDVSQASTTTYDGQIRPTLGGGGSAGTYKWMVSGGADGYIAIYY